MTLMMKIKDISCLIS